MKQVKFEIAHFELRWHAAINDEWEAMGSERRVFLGEVHPSLIRAEGLRGPSAIRCLVIMSALPVGKSNTDRCRVVLTVSYGGSSGRGTATRKLDDQLGSLTQPKRISNGLGRGPGNERGDLSSQQAGDRPWK